MRHKGNVKNKCTLGPMCLSFIFICYKGERCEIVRAIKFLLTSAYSKHIM